MSDLMSPCPIVSPREGGNARSVAELGAVQAVAHGGSGAVAAPGGGLVPVVAAASNVEVIVRVLGWRWRR
jgi:hypothetical protein